MPEAETPTLDSVLREMWLGARDTGVDGIRGALYLAIQLGLLSEEMRELWLRRIKECPGHADGSRAWCAYCGDVDCRGDEEDPCEDV